MSSKSTHNILFLKICSLFVVFITTNLSFGQTTTYGQSWNEVQFNRTINEKWSTELNIGTSFSSTATSSNIFQQNTQNSFRAWGHYYLTPRWKLSSFIAYFNNKDVPEIGQFKSPEWRYALQGIYYFHKTGYTLSTRMRVELRHMKNSDDEYENVLRYRQQIKYIQPLNSKFLREGVIYAIASDELFFKSGTQVTGHNFLDRNRFNIGGGYLFSNDIQVELTYANDFLPRDEGNQIINAAALTITFNNLFKKISKKLHHQDNSLDKED